MKETNGKRSGVKKATKTVRKDAPYQENNSISFFSVRRETPIFAPAEIQMQPVCSLKWCSWIQQALLEIADEPFTEDSAGKFTLFSP